MYVLSWITCLLTVSFTFYSWKSVHVFIEPGLITLWQPLEVCRPYFVDANLLRDSIPPPLEYQNRQYHNARKLTEWLCQTTRKLAELWTNVPADAGHPDGYVFGNYDIDLQELTELFQEVKRGLKEAVRSYAEHSGRLVRTGIDAIDASFIQTFNTFRLGLVGIEEALRKTSVKQYREETWNPNSCACFTDKERSK